MNEQPLTGAPKAGFSFLGISAQWGDESQDIDQSQTYNIYNPPSAAAKAVEWFQQNPTALYVIIGAMAIFGFVYVARKKKAK